MLIAQTCNQGIFKPGFWVLSTFGDHEKGILSVERWRDRNQKRYNETDYRNERWHEVPAFMREQKDVRSQIRCRSLTN